MKKHKKFHIKFKIIVLFILFIFLFSYSEASIRNNIKQISSNNSNIIANQIISDIVLDEINKLNINYDELIKIKYNSKQEISSVQVDSISVNKLQNNINYKIVQKIKYMDKINMSVNLGSLTSCKWLYAKGPTLNMTAIPVGKLNTKLISEFKSTGINQTIHRLNINISLSITTLLGFYKNTEKINIDIPISETIIVGKVPEYYTSVIGESEETISKINDYNPNNKINIE